MAEIHPIPTNPKFKNLTGRTFGRLTVESYAGRCGHTHLWNCICSCENKTKKQVHGSALLGGLTRSCTCLLRETTIKRSYRHGGSPVGKVLAEYNIYMGILKRCYNKNDHAYDRYGGSGIVVCDLWIGPHGFANFYADMGKRPSSKHSIDRFPDQNGPYSRDNCRWATDKEQARNQRKNHLITHEGETLCLSEWSERTGIYCGTILRRLKLGWSAHDALSVPVRPGNRYSNVTNMRSR